MLFPDKQLYPCNTTADENVRITRTWLYKKENEILLLVKDEMCNEGLAREWK